MNLARNDVRRVKTAGIEGKDVMPNDSRATKTPDAYRAANQFLCERSCAVGSALKKSEELIQAHFGSLQDRVKSAGFHRAARVERNTAASGEVRLMPQDAMGASLAQDNEAGALESSYDSVAGNLRQTAHTETSTSLIRISDSFGTGKPSDFRLSKYSSIASRIFARASSTVSPWLAQPGRAGTCTEYPPSVSLSSITFILPLILKSLTEPPAEIKGGSIARRESNNDSTPQRLEDR